METGYCLFHGVVWDILDSTAMELREFTSFSCQLQVSSARASLFLDAETCEFPSLSMGARGTLMYLNLTFMN